MSQSSLVKVGLPSHLAEGARLAKRIRQILDQREAAFARVEADFKLRMQAVLEESAEEVSTAVAASEEQQETTALPS